VYMPTTKDKSSNDEYRLTLRLLESIVQELSNKYKYVILAGDFNCELTHSRPTNAPRT